MQRMEGTLGGYVEFEFELGTGGVTVVLGGHDKSTIVGVGV